MIAIGPVTARTDDGWLLRGEVLAEGPRPVVALLLHAMMASRRSMDKPRGAGLGAALARAGLSVVSLDLRGHGESGPSARDGARYTYDDCVLHDVPTAVALARSLFPGKRVIVVGHSLGAHAALASAGVFPDRAPDAVASIAGNFWFPSDEPSLTRRAAKAATLRTWLGVAEAVGYFDPKPLGLGSDAVALPYIRQFWKVWSSDRYGSVDDRYDYAEALTRVTLPVFAVASEGDKLLAHPESVACFFARIGSPQKRLRIVTNAEHGGRAPDHMGLVTDARSGSIWREIAEWAAGIG
ncbi:alpha/beta fold hydrolase [Polyangium spumosum]|uniref:Alpha/beta fold hydrolase n=1 Tax=Polyangium spumosum TaxID=889282 RepID=A0A6N7Q5A5_9BACT|nr:alpha/beta fold hydrolase [Polyangium spumosum]MRG97454.1 alpha/beta fold hydrolase [Polyangium spumosum]